MISIETRTSHYVFCLLYYFTFVSLLKKFCTLHWSPLLCLIFCILFFLVSTYQNPPELRLRPLFLFSSYFHVLHETFSFMASNYIYVMIAINFSFLASIFSWILDIVPAIFYLRIGCNSPSSFYLLAISIVWLNL